MGAWILASQGCVKLFIWLSRAKEKGAYLALGPPVCCNNLIHNHHQFTRIFNQSKCVRRIFV